MFLACFAIGLGIGKAFMPLLTLAMAEVRRPTPGWPPASPTSPSRSAARRARGPQHLAANQSGAGGRRRGLTSALISEYQVGFLAGAAIIAAGILLAFLLLRPRVRAPELQIAEPPAGRPRPVAIEERAA